MHRANLILLLVLATDAASVQRPKTGQVHGGSCTLCTRFAGIAKTWQAALSALSEAEAERQLKEKMVPMLGSNEDLKLWLKDQAPQVLKMLKSLTPEQICASARICPPAKSLAAEENLIELSAVLKNLLAQANHGVDKTLCDYCIEYDSLLKRALADKEAQADVAAYFKPLCDALSFMKTPCSIWLDHYIPALMQHYADTLNPVQDCMNSPSCRPTKDAKLTFQLIRQYPQHLLSIEAVATSGRPGHLGEDLCGYCLEFAWKFKEFMTDPQSAGQLARNMVSACDILTKLKAACQSWIPTHEPAVIEMFGSEINPRVFCTNLTFCKPTDEAVHSLPAARKDGICSLCEMALQEVRQMLLDGKSRAAILKFIKDNLCTILPEDKDKCDSAVDAYGPIIIQLLAREMDPVALCKAIGSCSPNDTLLSADPIVRGISAVGPQQGTLCTFCEAAMKQVRKMLLEDKTRAGILKFIKNNLCTVLREDKDKCDHAVDTYGSIIMQLLATELNPATLCKLLGLCGQNGTVARTPERLERQRASARLNGPCALCELAVSRASGLLLGDSETQQLVKDSLCSFEAARDKCERTLDSFGPVFFRLLALKLDPAVVCGSFIGVCRRKTVETAAPNVEDGATSQLCTLCQMGVKFIQNKLETDNATRSKALANAESWCIFVPPANRTDCHNFIERYLIEIVVDIDPHRYCQNLQACAPDPTVEPPKVAQQSGVLRFRAAVEEAQRLRGRKAPGAPLL